MRTPQILTDVRELDGVLNEEDGDVVADQIPIAFLGVKFDCKASNIADGVGTASATEDSREPYKDGCGPGGVGQDAGFGDILGTLEELEGSECTDATGMDDPLRNTFMIEAMDLDIDQN